MRVRIITAFVLSLFIMMACAPATKVLRTDVKEPSWLVSIQKEKAREEYQDKQYQCRKKYWSSSHADFLIMTPAAPIVLLGWGGSGLDYLGCLAAIEKPAEAEETDTRTPKEEWEQFVTLFASELMQDTTVLAVAWRMPEVTVDPFVKKEVFRMVDGYNNEWRRSTGAGIKFVDDGVNYQELEFKEGKMLISAGPDYKLFGGGAWNKVEAVERALSLTLPSLHGRTFLRFSYDLNTGLLKRVAVGHTVASYYSHRVGVGCAAETFFIVQYDDHEVFSPECAKFVPSEKERILLRNVGEYALSIYAAARRETLSEKIQQFYAARQEVEKIKEEMKMLEQRLEEKRKIVK